MNIFGPPDVQKMETKNDVEGLIKALDYQKDLHVRANAASALGRIGDARAVQSLITALNDKEIDHRVADALGEIGDKGAVEPLIGIFTASRGILRQSVVRALGKLLDDRALNVLRDALKDEDYLVRIEAVKSLINIGGPAIYAKIPTESLLEQAKRILTRNWSTSRKDFFEATTWKVYKKFSSQSLIDDFYQSMRHGSKESMLASCFALGLKGNEITKAELREISKITFENPTYNNTVGGELRELASLILKSLGEGNIE